MMTLSERLAQHRAAPTLKLRALGSTAVHYAVYALDLNDGIYEYAARRMIKEVSQSGTTFVFSSAPAKGTPITIKYGGRR